MSYTKVLKWVLLVGLCLVFFIPYIITDGTLWPNMFFPFITGKNFAFRILVEALFGVYVILAIRDPKYRPRMSPLMWTLLAFMVWVGLSTIFSHDPTKSFWSNFERMGGYITTLHMFLYFLMVSTVVVAENWWERFFQVSIASSVLMGVVSVLQVMHQFGFAPSSQSGARADGFFGNAIYLAVFMLFNIFITLFMLVRQRRSVLAQSLYGIALVLQFAGLYFTETRGALLGVIGGIIIAALYIIWKGSEPRWRGLRQVSLWGLGLIVVLVVAFIAARNSSFVQHSSTLNRIASISLNDTTTRARIFDIWPMALKGSVDNPKVMALGWGEENFNFVFNKYYKPSMYNQEQWFDRAHNMFLDWLVAAGYPAMLLYIALFVLMAWAIFRSDLEVPEKAVLLGLLAAYAFNNLTVFDDLMSSVYFFTILALAHGLSRRELPGRLFLSRPGSDRAVAVAAPLVFVATLGAVWMLNVPGIARAENLLNAIMTQKAVDQNGQLVAAPKDPKENLAQFKVALGENAWPGTPLGQQETTEQLLQFASNLASAQPGTVDPSVKQDFFTLGQQAGDAMVAQRPHDARIELFMGAFYDAYGQYQPALKWLNMALADSPKKQQIMFEIGVANINSGNPQAALPILKQAYDEAPDYKDARILYAAALYYTGDGKDADQLLLTGPKSEGFGTLYVDDPRLMQVYANLKMYDRLIGIWKNRVSSDPNNAQNYIGLASAYFAAGDTKDTIAELQKAESIDPTLKSQADSLIQQIESGKLKPGQTQPAQ